MGSWLSLRDDIPKKLFQIIEIVVLESPNGSSTKTNTESDRRMVELVRDDKRAFRDEGRYGGGIDGEAHAGDKSVFLAHETSDKGLCLLMKIGCTTFQPAPTAGDTVSFDSLFDGVGAGASGLCEAEVIV